jgi:hypothetical protein
VASTGSGTLSYQWQSNTTSCAAAFTNIAGATGATYDAPAGLIVTTYYRRVTTSTLNAVACTANSNCITVTVTPNTWAGTVSNNWFTPGNWSCGIVPTAAMDVVIPAGTPNPCVVAAGTAQLRNFTINAGAVFTNNGTVNINGGGVTTNCGTYMGTGTFTGGLFSNNCATGIVSPGLSPGCTVFGAGYTNGAGTELIEIGGTTVCTQYDQLQVVGTATLSGTLNVVLFGGFIPSCGQSFTIMTANTVTGTFATINYPALAAGLSWNIQYNATSVVLSITGTPTATATPASQTTCSAAAITTIVLSGSPIAATTYNWTRDNVATVTGIAASGTGNISGTLTNTTNIPITVTFTITPTSGSCTGAAITATVLVNPTPNAVAAPASQSVCTGATITTIAISGNVAGTVYNWTRDNVATVTGIAASGSGTSIAGTLTNTTNFAITVTFSITPTANGCAGTPVTATVTVNPTPVVSITPAGPVTICQGSNVTLTASATCTSFAFSGLLSGANSVPANLSTARGVFNGTYNSGTNLLTLTVVFNGLTGGNASAAHIHSGSAVVNGAVIIPFAGFPAAASGTYSITANVPPAEIANFMAGNTYINIHNAGFPGGEIRSQITNVVSNVYTFSGAISGANSVPANGSTASGNYAGTYNNNTNQLTLNMIFNNLTGGNASAAHIHSGSPAVNGPVIIPFAGFPAAASGSYNLVAAVPPAEIANFLAGNTYINIHNAIFPGGEIRGNIAAPAPVCTGTTYLWSPGGATTPAITVTAANTYTVTATSNGCSSAPVGVVVNVNPVPVGSATPQTICSGGTTSVTLSATTPAAGTTYAYTAAIQTIPAGGTITGLAGGTANPIVQTLTNTGTSAGVIRYTVTPTYTNAGVACAGASFTVDVTVNPIPNAIATPATQTICSGSAITTIVNSGSVTGTVYNWTRDNPAVTGIANSGSGNISGSLTNPTNIPVTVTFTVTPSYTNAGVTCAGTPVTATVVVNPIPTVNAVANQVVCNGAATTAVTFTGAVTAPPGTVYNWTNNTTAIGLAASGTGNISSFNAINNGTAPVVATITVTPTYTNAGTTCTGTARTFTITVNPTATVGVPANAVVCNGTVQNTGTYNFTTTATGGTVTYNWVNNNITIGLGGSGTGSSLPTFTATNIGFAPITGTITVTPTFTNGGVSCVGTASSFTITVNPIPNAVATPASQTICNATAITTIALTGNVPGTVYNWTRNNGTLLGGPVFGIAASGAGNISGTLTNATNAPVTVTFTITPSYTNGGTTCTGTPITATVLVNPTPDAFALPATQTICSANPITPIVITGNVVGTVFNWTRDNTVAVTGIAASGAGDISGTLTNTTNAPVTVTFTIIPTYTNGGVTCTGATVLATVIVNPTPNAVATPASQTICSGNTVTPIVLTGNVAGTVFNWTRNNTVTVTGSIAASGVGDIIGTLINTTAAPITVTFTITPTGNGCTGAPITATVLVNPAPNAVATPAGQTICSGATITPILLTGAVAGTTYTWTRDNTVAVTGIAASGSGSPISGTLTNAGNAPVTVTFTITPTANGCTGPTTTATVLVNPIPNAVATPASQAACSGVAITPIILSGNVAGTTFTWTRNNTVTVTGIAASGSGDINGSLTNTTTAPITVTFTIIPSASGCPGAPITATVVVNPTPTAVAAPVSQTVCSGIPITTIVMSGTVSGTTYNWTRNNTGTVTGLPGGGTGNISGTLFNSTAAPVLVTFTITPTANSCPGASITATVLVNPGPNVVAAPVSQTICSGSAITTIVLSGSVAGTVYNWTRNNTATVSGIAASGSGNISGILTSTSPFPVTVTFTIIPTAGGCSGAPVTATVLVNPTPVINPVSNKVFCNGATTTLISFSGSAGSVNNWTNSNTAIGLAASGTGDILPFLATNNTNGPLVATITVSPVAAGCPGLPVTFTITVNPTPIVNPVASQTVCNGTLTGNINFISPTTGPTGSLTFNWTNSAPSIGLAASGTSGSIPPFTAVNTGSAPVNALITVTPVFTNGGVICTGTSQTFTITVNPTPTVNPVASQVLCAGSPTAAVNFTGSVFGTMYNWTNNNTSIGLAASGAGNIASFTTINAGTTAQVATITVTPNFSNGPVTCPGTPFTFTITVNPIPAVNPVASQTVCAGTTVNQAFSGPVAGTVYSWTNSNPAIGLAASGNGNLNFVSTNTTGAPLTGTITVTPSYTNAGGTCTGNTVTFTIAVNPIPTVNAVLPQVLCNGSGTAAVNFTGTVPGTVYNWTNSNASIGLAASGTGNIASFVATNLTAVVQTATITVTPTFTNGTVTCTGTPISFTITVNPTPSVNTIANQTVCNGTATTAVTISGPVAATTYNWTNNNPSIGLVANGANTIPSFIAINTGSTPVTATITVTPVFINGGIGCQGATSTFTITVNPTAVVNQPANQLLCNGANTAAVVFSGLPPGSTYNWTNSNTAIGLATTGTGNIASFVATNGTAAPISAVITVTPTSTGCGGLPVSFTITVNPTPTVNAIANQTLCAGATTAAVTISGPVAGTVYTWTNSNTTIGLDASGTGNIPAFVAVNPTINPVTATITVTPTYTNGGISCTGPTRSFTITVNPLPNIVFTNVPPRVCLTDTVVVLRATPAGGTWSGPGVSGNTFNAATVGVGVYQVSYTVTNAFGCTTTRNANIIVNDCIERHNVFQNAIRIWPNPSNGVFKIQFNSDKYKEFKVKIVNGQGQEMAAYEFKNLVNGIMLDFNLNRLASGEYFLYVYNSQESGVFPFVVHH